MPTQSPEPFTVMIVEDHPDQRALLELILQREGYRVLSTGDGLEAWEKLAANDAQLVLLDIMLPKMDGLEFIRRIRSDDRLKEIYVVAVTARRQERDVVTTLDLGADNYMIKPFSFAELLARIRVGVRRMTPRS
jgi:DNA-binding response OmpR family regulator